MRRSSALALLATTTLCGTAMAQYGPVVITGTVASNTLVGGRFQSAQPGDPVRMIFETLPGGFNPFWGPTGRFAPVDEASFELHIGHPGGEQICYSAANNTSIVFVNAGYVTPAVSTDEMEFFQMSLDSSLYRVYFKVTDYEDTVWSSPLIAELPHTTPNAPFDFKRWEVSDLYNPDLVSPGPILTINFDGTITVPCRADFNLDTFVTVQDIFDFLAAYFSSSITADVNGDNSVTVQDIFDYLALYFRGC